MVKNGAKFPFQNKLPRDREREIEPTFRQTRLDPFSRLARTRDLGVQGGARAGLVTKQSSIFLFFTVVLVVIPSLGIP